jgi:23S rRNA (uracil1939-C5)-methyltransferase
MLPRVGCPLRIEATVSSLAGGGEGVAHVDIAGERRAVFLPDTAPGDVVRAEVDPSRRPARGRVLELVATGPDRVTPACRWSTRCGGCDWMHLSPEAQAHAHVELVRAALPPEWRSLPIDVHPSPKAAGYRTRARLHARVRHGQVQVGLHQARSHEPVAIDACIVLDPALDATRAQLAQLLEGSRGRGEAQIALGARRLPVLELSWDGDLADACFARLERAVAAGDLAGARVLLRDAARPAAIGDPTPWIEGADGRPLELAPGGFGQASDAMNAALGRHVADQAVAVGADKAVELYAGAGNLSVLLARELASLVLVESSGEACEAARRNLAARDLSARARVVTADAESYAWAPGTRLVVLDPPRTGARAVAEKLASSRVRHVIYVSCDPQTLGRDLALLAPHYTARSIATFEMFPQTSHVEAVVALDRTAGRPEGHARTESP